MSVRLQEKYKKEIINALKDKFNYKPSTSVVEGISNFVNWLWSQNKIVRNILLLTSNSVKLLLEQSNFCAYTEKYITGLDSVEVEHFNASIKYNDDYFNYYAVIRSANSGKRLENDSIKI